MRTPMLTASVVLSALFVLSGCHLDRTGKTPTRSGAPMRASIGFGDPQVAGSMAWNPDGRRLAFSMSPAHDGKTDWSRSHVYVWDTSQAVPHISSTPGPFDATPAWLGDGGRLVMTRERDNVYWPHQFDTETSNLARLPRPQGMVAGLVPESPNVFLDGRTLLFAAKRNKGRYSICTWNGTDNSVRPLLSLPNADAVNPLGIPGWQRFLYVKRMNGQRRLVVASLPDKRTLHTSPASAGKVNKAAVSPRHDYVVYTSTTKNGDELHKLRLIDGQDTVIARASVYDDVPPSIRSTNGDIAVSALGDDKLFHIRIYDSSGKLKAESPPGMLALCPAWSPNGKLLAYWSAEQGIRDVKITAEEITQNYPDGWRLTASQSDPEKQVS